ncbi:O-antigen ligase family protein [Flavobacterium tistrianum]|uniref:O-antigen ligase family protein n=1 Tax=Flavobacterium tistrianum TaxID=1685414 RepID=UPI000DAB66E6|nr:O-antigen ligase family protein [Flavobacterium tistrianum]KAF2338156.1 hypothetical protein DMB71_19185 [Flavobacterium tistrianum]
MNYTIENILNETKGKLSIPNFIVFSFISLILIIDFFPYFESHEIINPQFLYLSLLNLVMAIYFFFNSRLISPDIFPLFKCSYVFKLYLTFIFFCALSFLTARNTSLVYTKLTQIIIVFCLFINLSILLRNKLNLLYKITFIVSIAALVQSWQQLCHFLIMPKHASIIDLLTNMKGNTGNINILAASLTIKVPFILIGIIHFSKYTKWLLIVTLFSVTTVIFLTGARTPLINLFFIYTAFITYLFKEHSFEKSTFFKASLLIIPLLIAVVFSNSIFEKSKDKERYVSLENRVQRINAEDASSKARLIFWGNVFEMSKKSPLLGIGLGNYQIESIPYEKTTANDSNVSLHAHNDFLEILAETGVLNGLIYLSLFISLLIINLKKIIKSQHKERKMIALLTLMLLIVYGIDAFFNFPMYRPTMSIFFSLLVALSLINVANKVMPSHNASFKVIFILLIVITLITSYSSFIIYKASHLEYLIVRDDINMKDKGILTGNEVVDNIKAYPNVFSSSESFYEYAGIYYTREKNYDKALKCFSKASKINPYSGRIEFYKYVISKNKGNIDSAYIYSKQAFYLRPRNYEIYNVAINFAIRKKDTAEILKEHKLFSLYRPMPETWLVAYEGLKNSGYNHKNLSKFIDKGLKLFPKDSILKNERINILHQNKDDLVATYITEGQNFENESKFDQAIDSYRKALKIDNENIYASQNIGFFYLKRAQPEKAIPYLLKALKYPGLNGGKTEFFLAISYLKVNDNKSACKYLKIAKDKKYDFPQQLIEETCQK